MTPGQCRAARALIGMSRADLAHAALVTSGVVMGFEEGTRVPQKAYLDAIRRSLEAAGVMFVDRDGHGVGVRLRK